MPDFLRWVLRRTACRAGAAGGSRVGRRAPRPWRERAEPLPGPGSHATSAEMATAGSKHRKCGQLTARCVLRPQGRSQQRCTEGPGSGSWHSWGLAGPPGGARLGSGQPSRKGWWVPRSLSQGFLGDPHPVGEVGTPPSRAHLREVGGGTGPQELALVCNEVSQVLATLRLHGHIREGAGQPHGLPQQQLRVLDL